jgi:hypothetical protein
VAEIAACGKDAKAETRRLPRRLAARELRLEQLACEHEAIAHDATANHGKTENTRRARVTLQRRRGAPFRPDSINHRVKPERARKRLRVQLDSQWLTPGHITSSRGAVLCTQRAVGP